MHIWSSSNQNVKAPSILEGGVDILVDYDNPNDLKHEIESAEPCNYKFFIDEKR